MQLPRLLSRADPLHSPLHLLLLLLVGLRILILLGLLSEPRFNDRAPQHVDGANRPEEEEKPEPVGGER